MHIVRAMPSEPPASPDWCVICGKPSTHTAFPSRPILTRQVSKDDGTATLENEKLPPYLLCDEHFREMTKYPRGGFFGWCDDPSCRRWGRVGDPSPCGAPFLELPSGLPG